MNGTCKSGFERMPVDQLELDMTNPRIAKWVEMYGNQISAEQMSLALGAGDSQADDSSTTFYSLRESIRTNGGIIHPIIVNRKAQGRLVVVEGNTRTLIYREFKQQKLKGDWNTIPAMVYDGLSDKEIDAIRLQAHLVGPRAWDPYSKAKYLDLLRNSQHLTLPQIFDFCGGRKKEVLNYVAGYGDMESHYRPLLDSDDQFDPTRFSAFVELQNPRIQQALLNAQFTKTDFARWVRDGLIAPLATVRQLPRILENPKSKTVFLKDDAQDALKVLEVPPADTNLAEVALAQLTQGPQRRLGRLEWRDCQRIKSDPRRICWDRRAA